MKTTALQNHIPENPECKLYECHCRADGKKPLVRISDEFIILTPRNGSGHEYHLPLCHCQTVDAILHWTATLTEMRWASKEMIRNFIDAAIDA